MTIEQIDLKSWNAIEGLVNPIKTKKRYKEMLELVENILERVGQSKSHPMLPILETLSLLIEDYEDRTLKIPKSSPVTTLEYLMQEHGLNQSELPEIGSQSIVSDVLKGKRKLNLRQVKALSKKFGLTVDTFV